MTNRDRSLAAHAVAEAALKDLDAQLDRRDYATTLHVDGAPHLTIVSRHAQLAEDVYADSESYSWPWGQLIAAVGNPKAAADKISYVLAAPGNPMTDCRPARPRPAGHDEILLTAPPGRCLCNSLAHRRLGCLAEVIVTFGELGTAWQPDALWQHNWGKSFPMCTACWTTVRQVAQQRRPGLVITDTARQPAG